MSDVASESSEAWHKTRSNRIQNFALLLLLHTGARLSIPRKKPRNPNPEAWEGGGGSPKNKKKKNTKRHRQALVRSPILQARKPQEFLNLAKETAGMLILAKYPTIKRRATFCAVHLLFRDRMANQWSLALLKVHIGAACVGVSTKGAG
eukprot:scaffold462_cov195-Pinguiococcus_pyrenoidosus.AAC.20